MYHCSLFKGSLTYVVWEQFWGNVNLFFLRSSITNSVLELIFIQFFFIFWHIDEINMMMIGLLIRNSNWFDKKNELKSKRIRIADTKHWLLASS